jgi:outer membrane lipoprotein-sorting protein
MKSARDIRKLARDLRHPADRRTHERIVGHLLDTLKQAMPQVSIDVERVTTRRTIMRSPVVKLAAAAGVVLAVVLSATLLIQSTPTASAAVILQQAAEAMGKLKSFHIQVEMRTQPGDNFALIGLDYDFVRIDLWKQFTDDEWGKWRLEEPGRIVVMDGQRSIMLAKPNYIFETVDRNPERWWRECLVEAGAVMAREAKEAAEHPADFTSYHERGEDGRDMLVVTVEAKAKVPEGDYLHDQSIEDSDHLKIYRFDAETKLLKDHEILVHADGEDVLIYRLIQAEYNIDLDPALFHLETPQGTIHYKSPEILPDNKRYEDMTPKEAATVFFTACANENWDELLKFMSRTEISQSTKDRLGGLTILEIGEPFQSPGYAGWFIPYKIRFKSGGVQEHKLALRNDNSAHRFVLDGGI